MSNEMNMLHNSTINKRSLVKQTNKQNLLKKRPSTTKLDLQKIFQESIQLTQVFKKLSSQNHQLKQQYQKVQTTKSSRQSLISLVEQIVKQKAKQLSKNPLNQSSWLVHKLNAKVYELKNKIEAKEKAIRQVEMSKQNQWIRQKQCQIKCLDDVLEHIKRQKPLKQGQNEQDCVQDYDDFEQNNQNQAKNQQRHSIMSGIKQIVWLQQQIRQKQDQILQAQRQYQDQQRQVRKVMIQISKKKAQLKEIKQLEQQFYRAQQQFKQEKKKKEQRLAGNKTYLDQLIQSRHNQLKKLDQLKEKYTVIQKEENKNIQELEDKLEKLKKQYQKKHKARQELVFRIVQEPISTNKQRWVKRVTFNEIKGIAKNLNHFIALKRVPKDQIFKRIFKQQDEELSIRQVIKILQEYPFQIQDQKQRELLARYCIQDSGEGYFMQDMQTSEAVPIIKSVLSKLIGEVRIYTQEQQAPLMQKTGELMHKFHSLVQQNIQTKQGAANSKKVTKQVFQQAIISTELDLNHDQINFIILYMFSLTHNINQLQVCNLGKMLQTGIKWLTKKDNKKIHPVVQSPVLNRKQQEEYAQQFQ